MSEFTKGVPWWVKWVAIPVIAIVVFGGMLMSFIGFVVALLFKILLFAALVAGLIFVVRKFTGASSSGSGSSGDKW